MSAHVPALLPELVLGTFAPAAPAEVEAHLSTCAGCRAERDALAEALADFVLGETAPPPAGLRARLDAALAGQERFAPFTGRFARLFQLPEAEAATLLAEAAQGVGFEPAPVPEGAFKHFRPGPALAGCDAGFVRVRAGTTFPRHRHGGDEHTLVVQGRSFDHLTGATLPPGEAMVLGPGTEHSFEAVGEEDLIFAVLLLGGVEFGI